MRYILILISVIVIAVILFANFISLENQLSDCQFECNHLQTKLYRYQEFNDYVPAMEQILPPLVLAQLKVATLMIQNKRHRGYERYEQPLLTEKERKQTATGGSLLY